MSVSSSPCLLFFGKYVMLNVFHVHEFLYVCVIVVNIHLQLHLHTLHFNPQLICFRYQRYDTVEHTAMFLINE